MFYFYMPDLFISWIVQFSHTVQNTSILEYVVILNVNECYVGYTNGRYTSSSGFKSLLNMKLQLTSIKIVQNSSLFGL